MEKTIQNLIAELKRLSNLLNNSALMKVNHISSKIMQDIENIYTNLDYMYIINTSEKINILFQYIEQKANYYNMLHEYANNLN